MALKITSPAFEHEGPIPKKFSCDGEDVSPALSWEDVPANAKSLALICDDPDAPGGTFVHWLVFNLPADEKGLPEAVVNDKQLENGALQGENHFRKIGYGGPCPPGGTHRYYFKLYALDTVLVADAAVNKQELVKAMEGHILEEAQLMGTYSRS